MKKVLIIILLFLLIGCVKTVYTHPYKGADDFERDKYECEKIAEQSAANWGIKGNPFYIADEIWKCMRLKQGWKPERQQ